MPLDPLEIKVVVEASGLSQLSAASQETAKAVDTLSSSFSKNAAAATQGKMRASEWVAMMNAQEAAAKRLAAASEETAAKVSGMDRAMASAGVRIAAGTANMGMMGGALGRVAAASSTLAPILAAAFPLAVGLLFVDMLQRAIESYQKWIELGEQTVHGLNDQTLSIRAQNDALDVTNARLENQIAKLEHRPENFLAVALAEDKVRADELAKSLGDALQKTVQLLEAGPGIFSEIFLGKGDVSAVGDLLKPLERQYQLAQLSNDAAAEKNVLLQAQTVLQQKLAEEQAQSATIEPSLEGSATVIGREKDIDAVNAYKAALAGVNDMLARIGKTATNSADEHKLASDQTAKQAIDAANKISDRDGELNEDMQRNAAKELKSFEELQKGKLELAAQVQKELTRIAEEAAKATAATLKSIDKESADAYVSSWREAIKSQDEAFRASQRGSERQIQGVGAQASLATAGVSGGPITSAIHGEATKEQMTIAASAMAAAQAAAANYNLQLAAIARAQAQVDTSTTAGVDEYRQLQTQLDQISRQYDAANDASQRWGNTMLQLAAQLKANFGTIGTAMTSAIDTGAQSFNSNFVKMAQGGQSFGAVMQKTWSAMAESFITSILRMAERWVAAEVLKLAATKAAGAAATESSLAQNAVQKLSAAKTAAAQAMTTVPFPLDLVVAPIVFAAAMAFEKGGIVPGPSGSAMPALVHGGEGILPAKMTTLLMHSADNFGKGTRGGGEMPGSSPGRPVNFHMHTTVNTLTSEGMQDALSAHGDQLVSYLRGRLRRMGISE